MDVRHNHELVRGQLAGGVLVVKVAWALLPVDLPCTYSVRSFDDSMSRQAHLTRWKLTWKQINTSVPLLSFYLHPVG